MSNRAPVKKASPRGYPNRYRGGRDTRFPYKVKPPQSFGLTQEALDLLSATAERLEASRSDIVNHLIREYAKKIKASDLPELASPN